MSEAVPVFKNSYFLLCSVEWCLPFYVSAHFSFFCLNYSTINFFQYIFHFHYYIFGLYSFFFVKLFSTFLICVSILFFLIYKLVFLNWNLVECQKWDGYVGKEKGGRKGRIRRKRQKESERAIFVELWYIYIFIKI